MRTRIRTSLALAAVLTAAFASPLHAISLKELFTVATRTNQDYVVYNLDLELARLKKTKGEIEAKVDADRVNSQLAYINSLDDFRRSVLAFHDEVVEAVFSAAMAELDFESAELAFQNAAEDQKYAESRRRNGLISEEGYREIEINAKATRTSRDLAEWALKDAKDRVRLVLGAEWSPELIPEAPGFPADETLAEFMAKDLGLEKARLAEKLASIKLSALAANVSVYDRRIQETESLKAKVAAVNAENDASRSFEGSLASLRNKAALVSIRNEEKELKRLVYAEALRQYESGLISLNEKNLRRMASLTAERNLLAAQASYIKSIGAHLSMSGADPLGL